MTIICFVDLKLSPAKAAELVFENYFPH